MALFAVTWAYSDDADVIDPVRAAHGTYIKKLAGDRALREAGAWSDGTGALLIFDVSGEPVLRALLDADPYTSGGVVTSESIHQWSPGLGRFTD